MNTPRLIALAIAATSVFAFAGAAHAQEADADTWMAASSVKSRAQVQSELAQARADGTIKFGSASYLEPVKTRRTRAEVVAEMLNARETGELAAINSETHDGAPGVNQRGASRLARSAR